MNAIEKAKELGGTIDGGINWTWAMFTSGAAAEAFLAWLNPNGYEHRGIYPPDHRDLTWGVRFR